MLIRCEDLTEDHEDALIARAYVAYKKSAKKEQYHAAEPALGRCNFEEHEGKWYVTLNNNGQTLAVFRVKPNGMLKRMVRPPKELLLGQ